jgi:hypothetical protein
MFSDFQLGQPTADLGVTVDDGLTTVAAGDGLTHLTTIIVGNAGPSDATAVGLVVTWPAGLTQGLVTPSQGTCLPVGAGPDFSCDLGTIAAAGGASVTVAYSVPTSTPSGSQTTTATVTSAVIDPVPGNDSASDTTRAVPFGFVSPDTAIAAAGSTTGGNGHEGLDLATLVLAILAMSIIIASRDRREKGW